MKPDLSEGNNFLEKLFYLIVIMAVIFLVYWIRRKFKSLENRIVILENGLEVQTHNNINAFQEQEKVWSMQMDYTQRITEPWLRDGLEWDTLKNRRREGLHLKVQ